MQLALAAFFWFRDPDRHPNFEALRLSPTLGWLVLLTAASLALFFIAQEERWRRLWLSVGDPRSIALFRIVFGVMTLSNVNGLYENWEYLFSDDGIFNTQVAQQVRARTQFAGFGDGSTTGEATGFFSLTAFWEWLKGPTYSLLLFNSGPLMFWTHIIAFQFFMVALILGWQTRWTKWVAWFLFHSIILRNTIYWEGTENVYRTFFFLLCLSRCGSAYSVDNWLRCRRLRRTNRLREPGGTKSAAGDSPDDDAGTELEPIYRAVPMWPRYLMIIQVAVIYGYAGPTKNGSVWQAGDSFYYSFNLDHFYRFPPQELSAIFGTNLFRLNTHVVHYWQMFFPLVLVGLALRWVRRERLPLLTGWHLGLSRAGLLGASAGFLAMTLWAYPVHYVPKEGGMSLETVRLLVGVLAPVALITLGLFLRKLWHAPPSINVGGREFRLDIVWFCSWVLGRRLWLGLGFIFHLHLVLLMNIGWFNPGVLAGYITFLNGPELANIFSEFRRSLARLRRRPPDEVAGIEAIPAQDARLSAPADGDQRLHPSLYFVVLALALISALRHAATLPDMWKPLAGIARNHAKVDLPRELIAQYPLVDSIWFFACIFGILLVITVRRTRGQAYDPRFAPLLVALPLAWSYLAEFGWVHMRWSLPLTLAACLLATRKSGDSAAAASSQQRPVVETPPTGLAYGALGRVVAGGLVIYHLLGMAIWMLPEKDSLGTFRTVAREPIKWWIRSTHSTQSWAMFAPNPPRSNLFLRTVVHEGGEKWDLNNDVYACFEESGTPEICDAVYPIPWSAYSRQRKMNRRIAGGENCKGSWYQKWHTRWVCRDWARTHGGEPPDKVELIKVTYPIPSPQAVAKAGPYDPRRRYIQTRKHESVYTAKCKTAPFGRLTNEQRARLGFEAIDERLVKGWVKERCRKWNEQMRRRAIEEGRDPEGALVDCLDEEAFEVASAAQKEFEAARKAETRAKKRQKSRAKRKKKAAAE
jgi:hypothetical protein